MVRARHGAICNAIFAALSEADRPMRGSEIRSVCEERLGVPVLFGTVRGLLSEHSSRGEQSKYARVSFGTYRLSEV